MHLGARWTEIEVIFFDAGHTLLRPEPAVEERYAQTAARWGAEVEPAEIRARFRQLWRQGRLERQRALYRTDKRGVRRFWRQLVSEVFAPWRGELSNFEDFFEQLYTDFATAEAWHLFEDVEPCLDRLAAAGFRLAVISNWDQRLRSLLEVMEIAGRFEELIISAEVGVEKPAQAIFDHAVGALGVARDRALHVGDSLEDDLIGARDAGLEAALLVRDGAPTIPDDDQLPGDVPVVATFTDLTDALVPR